ncbi:hypothetical protein CISG_06589 [Coccidioides immitis RMSCC 3703]|uniref:Uncharacterized protein n=2 Tax=Coccidioides immitis TaxID=5501 RepID=A0A0J8R3R8_COCIT|nr:hypothetical protein CIRG_05859 [Coccidioides immitis RMSCC 2394]KMU78353.1 hypothetical protein CISG_06589 [Coccidioides immitis RMSCC 3703]
MPEELPGASSQSPPRHSVVGLIDLRGALRTGFATSRGEQTKHRGPLSSFKLQPRTGEGAAVPTDDNVRGCEPLPSPSPHHRCTDGVHGYGEPGADSAARM